VKYKYWEALLHYRVMKSISLPGVVQSLGQKIKGELADRMAGEKRSMDWTACLRNQRGAT